MYDSNVLVAYGKIPKMDGFTELHDFENKLQKTKYISTDEIVPYFTEDMKFTIATYGLISNGQFTIDINEERLMAINNSDTMLEEINAIINKHAKTLGIEDIPVVFRSVRVDPDAFYGTSDALTTINGHQVLLPFTSPSWKDLSWPYIPDNEAIEKRIEREIREENRRQYKFEKYSYLKGVNFSLCENPESPVYSSDVLKGYGKIPEFETYEQANSYVVSLGQDAENLTEIMETQRDQNNSTIPSFVRISCPSASSGDWQGNLVWGFPGREYLWVTVTKNYNDTELEEMYDLIERYSDIEDVPVVFKLDRREQIDQYFEVDTEIITENQRTEDQNSLHGFHAFSTLLMLVIGVYTFFRKK